MSRARNIKPGFFANEDLAEIDPIGRLLFIGLWTLADRDGRLEDRPKRIKGELFPYDNCDINALLDDLQKYGFILRYEVDGGKYIQIVNFSKHQNPHPKEPSKDFPMPESDKQVASREKKLQASDKQVAKNADILNPDILNPDSTSSSDSLKKTKEEEELAAIVTMYEDIVGQPVRSQTDRELLIGLLDSYTVENIKAAFREAAKSGAKARNLRYVEGCLKRWANGDIRAPVTLSAEEKAARDRKRAEEKARYEQAERDRVFRELGVVVNESA